MKRLFFASTLVFIICGLPTFSFGLAMLDPDLIGSLGKTEIKKYDEFVPSISVYKAEDRINCDYPELSNGLGFCVRYVTLLIEIGTDELISNVAEFLNSLHYWSQNTVSWQSITEQDPDLFWLADANYVITAGTIFLYFTQESFVDYGTDHMTVISL